MLSLIQHSYSYSVSVWVDYQHVRKAKFSSSVMFRFECISVLEIRKISSDQPNDVRNNPSLSLASSPGFSISLSPKGDEPSPMFLQER